MSDLAVRIRPPDVEIMSRPPGISKYDEILRPLTQKEQNEADCAHRALETLVENLASNAKEVKTISKMGKRAVSQWKALCPEFIKYTSFPIKVAMLVIPERSEQQRYAGTSIELFTKLDLVTNYEKGMEFELPSVSSFFECKVLPSLAYTKGVVDAQEHLRVLRETITDRTSELASKMEELEKSVTNFTDQYTICLEKKRELRQQMLEKKLLINRSETLEELDREVEAYIDMVRAVETQREHPKSAKEAGQVLNKRLKLCLKVNFRSQTGVKEVIEQLLYKVMIGFRLQGMFEKVAYRAGEALKDEIREKIDITKMILKDIEREIITPADGNSILEKIIAQ